MTKKKIFLTFALLLCGALHAQTVYVSKTGHKYHATPTCWALSRSKNPQAINIEDAKQRGLEPCKLCYRTPKEPAAKKGD